MRNLAVLTILIVLLSVITVSAVTAEELFDYEYYKGSGLVTACGMKLLLIDEPAGNVPPLERAKIVAERLNSILYTGYVYPDNFRVGYYNGQVVLEHIIPGSAPTLIATVDSNLARKFQGARGSRTTLAYWWLSLLKDNLLLIQGEEPVYTAPYGTGYIFERIYMKAIKNPKYQGGPIPVSVIKDAIETLAQEDIHFQYDFERLYTSVPGNFTLSSASDLDNANYSPAYLEGPSFASRGPSIPGPGFQEETTYATNDVYVPPPQQPYYAPPPEPEVTYTDDSSVSYSPPAPEEPVYYEDSTYYYEPYYEPSPSTDLPADSPQPLPTDYDYLLKKLNMTSSSGGKFSTYVDEALSKDISLIKYRIMDFNENEIDSMVTSSYPFICELEQTPDAKFLEVDVFYKDGEQESMIYKLFPSH